MKASSEKKLPIQDTPAGAKARQAQVAEKTKGAVTVFDINVLSNKYSRISKFLKKASKANQKLIADLLLEESRNFVSSLETSLETFPTQSKKSVFRPLELQTTPASARKLVFGKRGRELAAQKNLPRKLKQPVVSSFKGKFFVCFGTFLGNPRTLNKNYDIEKSSARKRRRRRAARFYSAPSYTLDDPITDFSDDMENKSIHN